MYISKLFVRNFKKWESLDVEFNENVNLLIGVNNSGKTTILEALNLWKTLYDLNMNKKSKSFYQQCKNISFSEIPFIRIDEDYQLFYKKPEEAEICLTVNYCQKEYNLGFIIKSPTQLRDTYFKVDYTDNSEFNRFAEDYIADGNTTLRQSLSLSLSAPVASIPAQEEYIYRPKIKKYIQSGLSHNILRNKIIIESKNMKTLEQILSDIFGHEYKLTHSRYPDDIKIKLYLSKDHVKSELSSYGSGIIQVLEMFSNLDALDTNRHIALIDEPDAHIHESLHEKIINQFRKQTRSQFFITSHNTNFINYFSDEETIMLNGEHNQIIKSCDYHDIAHIIKTLKGDLSSTQSLIFSKKVVIVEGETDQFYQNLLLIMQALTGSNGSYYFAKSLGLDHIKEKVNLLKAEFNKHTDMRSKSVVLVADSDYRKKEEKIGFINSLSKIIQVVFIESMCLESSFFSDDSKLSRILVPLMDLNEEMILQVIEEQVKAYQQEIINSTTDTYMKAEQAYLSSNKRQGSSKSGHAFSTFLKEYLHEGLHLVLSKKMSQDLLLRIVNDLKQKSTKLDQSFSITFDLIIHEYLNSIQSVDMIYPCHYEAMKRITSEDVF